MAQFSFDIVSEYDKAQVTNAFDQTQREIANRYDFKGTPADIAWLKPQEKNGIIVTGNSQYQLDAIIDIFRKKLALRGQSQKILDTTQEPVTANLQAKQTIPFKQGLNKEQAKQLTDIIRTFNKKTKAQIQGDAIRVTSSSKNDLQAIITHINSQDLPMVLSFTNYR